jgi:hypothetical protein
MSKNKKTYGSLLILIMITALSCTNHQNNKVAKTNTIKEKGLPVIEFDTTYHDFGTLIQGEKASFTFKFRNTGTSSLIIKDAFSTCGCTVPDFSDEPVSPGAEGEIEVLFDSDGKQGLQYKTVTLKLNTKIEEKTLTIKANVLKNNYKS